MILPLILEAHMDIEKRNNLILNNLKLVHYQYNRKFSSLPIEKEDIISIGILGLIKAIDNYDKEKGYTFSTYALKCIDNEILQGVKKNKSLANINLEDIIYEDISYADIISDNINIEEEYLYNEIVFNIKDIENIDYYSIYLMDTKKIVTYDYLYAYKEPFSVITYIVSKGFINYASYLCL